jgi:hypothetical protein
MQRPLDIYGQTWTVRSLPEEAQRREADPWHYARVRFDPPEDSERLPRETWLRLEEDVPAADVLDQYSDEALVEAFMVAEQTGV